MVAAQYILLAGQKIAEDCLKKPIKGFGPDEWRHWTRRLEEISRQKDGNIGLASVAQEAHKYMVSLHSEFLDSRNKETDA